MSLRTFLVMSTFTTLGLQSFAFAPAWAESSSVKNPPELLTQGSYAKAIPFRDPEGLMDFTLRFRMQTLLQEEGALGEREGRTTAAPRRVRLRLTGRASQAPIRFNLQLSFSRTDMDWDNTGVPNTVRDANVIFPLFPDHLELLFGQAKLPGNRQRVISSGDLQFIDRSLVNRAFNIDRDFGFQLRYRSGDSLPFPVLSQLALTSGGGRNTRSRLSSSHAVTGRLEIQPLGEFTGDGDTFEGALIREDRPRVAIATGYSVFEDVDRLNGTIGPLLLQNRRDFAVWINDFLFKFRGTSLYGEYLRKRFQNGAPQAGEFVDAPSASFPSSESPAAGEGAMIQIGQFIAQDWEIVGRGAALWAERRGSLPAGVAETQRQATLGINRYIRGHRVKLQADLSLNEQRATSGIKESNWIGRFQMELGI